MNVENSMYKNLALASNGKHKNSRRYLGINLISIEESSWETLTVLPILVSTSLS